MSQQTGKAAVILARCGLEAPAVAANNPFYFVALDHAEEHIAWHAQTRNSLFRAARRFFQANSAQYRGLF
jgi:hypothetical protein